MFGGVYVVAIIKRDVLSGIMASPAGAKQCSVDDQLLQLKKAVEDAKEQLECFHGQLNRRKSGTKLDWQERRRQVRSYSSNC